MRLPGSSRSRPDLETARREYRAENMGDADLALAEGRIHVGEPPDIATRPYVVKNGRYHLAAEDPPARRLEPTP